MLPLVMLGLERLVNENKCLLYCISLGFCIYTNYYIAIMICISVVLYFVVLMFVYNRNRSFKIYLKKFFNFCLYSLLAGGLAACLLLPEDAVKDAMFVYGLGDKVKVLSRKYSEYKYQCFCEMADALGVSRSALSFRMEQLGLLERNELIAEARARRGVG